MVRRGSGVRAGASSAPPAAAASSDEPTPLDQLRALNRELAERDRQGFQTRTTVLDPSIVRTAEPFIEFVTKWVREYYSCTRDEAFERMKRGESPDGLSMSLLQKTLWDWPMPDERGLRSTMIADLGRNVANRYLNEMRRIRSLALLDPYAKAGEPDCETLNVPREFRNKYLLTIGTIRAQWTAYLQVIGREHMMDIPADQLNESNYLPYASMSVHFVSNIFPTYVERGLLRPEDDESQQR
ncbi:hypothetical protein PSEUBRA_005631 [Kalmanozyma brasiliensis GHG001]|uniref:uncharacterized protein n=1 Tax=Kalmanozyma brasiliensis (strain GHG001) TaxID=1365824 RepID=UPI0028682347|nr:uncharacterized protein PSEUBRA_005631 [Kalmanozyma brasiliensis GHG001]KAF6767540.1 hypothetical protein PSEUBRA_005631 [Kalmanozyma brasiliensis GHG001]